MSTQELPTIWFYGIEFVKVTSQNSNWSSSFSALPRMIYNTAGLTQWLKQPTSLKFYSSVSPFVLSLLSSEPFMWTSDCIHIFLIKVNQICIHSLYIQIRGFNVEILCSPAGFCINGAPSSTQDFLLFQAMLESG